MNRHIPPLLVAITGLLTGPAWSSALFDDTAANLWLVDTDSGQVTSYGFGDWLEDYQQVSSDLPLGTGFQALVNSLPNSSVPMSGQQPGVSLIGLSEAERQLGADTGPDLLKVTPADGFYDGTIGVVLQVEPRQLDQGDRTLNWRVNEGDWQTRKLSVSQLEPDDTGYIEQPVYLIRDGEHRLEAELRSGGTLLTSVSRTYQIASDHPLGDYRDTDTDGVPDLVEKALGLNPLNPDLDTESHLKGWSRFDLWLRCDAQKFGDCTEPNDEDKDGWTDFDENWRNTRHDDVIVNGFLDAPKPESEEKRQLVRHYQEFPAARRLYEVEYRFDGTPLGLTPDQLTAATLFGEDGWQLGDLVTSSDLSNAVLTAAAIAPSRLLSNAETALGAGQWPVMRLPAGDAAMIRTSRVLPAGDGTARHTDLLYLPPKADLEPVDFSVDDYGSWTTADEWKDHYRSWLQDRLVQPASQSFTPDTSLPLLVLEQLLAEEARLRAISDQSRLGVPGQPLSWLSDLKTDLDYRTPGATLTQLINSLDTELKADGLLAADASLIRQWLSNIPAGLNSSTWLQQKLAFNQAGENIGCFIPDDDWNQLNAPDNDDLLQQFLDRCPVYHTGTQLTLWQTDSQDLRYRLRLMLLPQAAMRLGNDQTLADASGDSDNDTLTNGQEITVRPYRFHTLPWLDDTDTDGIADASDLCPLDRYNGCTGTPDENQLYPGNDLSVSKPASQGTVLLSVQLDRPAIGPVTVEYQVWASDDDSAVAGEDFIASTGEVVIQPGQTAVLIPVTLLGGGSGQQFRLEVLTVDGAQLDGDPYTLVGLTAFDPLAPVARVMSTNLSVEETQSIVLDASSSYDPNGFDLSFDWQQTSGRSVTLAASPETGFAELTAPNLASNELLRYEVTVQNTATLTDSVQIEVNVLAEDESPVTTGTPLYEQVRQTVLTIPIPELLLYLNDPEGSEITLDLVLSQPEGSLANLTPTDLVIDGDVALPQSLGTQRGQSGDLVPWREDGFAFLTSPVSGTPRLYGWHPDSGLEVLYQENTGESLRSLVADPIQDRLYFDRIVGGDRYVSWLSSDGSTDGLLVNNAFGGSYSRQANGLHDGLYLCSTDTNTWLFVSVAGPALADTTFPCSYTPHTLHNNEQVCLESGNGVACTVPGAGTPALSNAFTLLDQTLVDAIRLNDTFLFLTEYNDGPLTELKSYTHDNQLELVHQWSPGPVAETLNTDSGQLIMAASLGDRIEMLSWQAGDPDVTVHGSNYFSGTGQTYSYLSPLQITEAGEVYWLVQTGADLRDVHEFDLQSNQFNLIRSLDLAQSTVTNAYDFELALSPRGPMVATVHSDGLCHWQRLSNNGDLAAPHLETTLCNARLADKQVEVHLNYDDPSNRYFRVSGGDFVGQTLIQIQASDSGGNTAVLPIELDVTEAP